MAWMMRIPDSRPLYQVIMPGSHDAGLYTVTSRVGPCTNDNLVKTQSVSIRGQLDAGSRFFDLRVYNKKWKEGSLGSRVSKKDLYLGHFAERDWRTIGIKARKGHHDIGGYGPPLQEVLDDIADYMADDDAEKEAVILRFSHIKKKHAPTVIQMIKATLGTYLYKHNGVGSKLVSRFTMGAVRNKVIACFESGPFSDEIDASKGIHAFGKYGKGAKEGLVTCGEFADDKSITTVIKHQKKKITEHEGHNKGSEKDHLGMVYWQVTGGDIETNTKRTNGCMEQLGGTLCQGLLKNNRNWLATEGKAGINIVGFDFVDAQHCKMVYDLNINFQF